MDTPDPVAASPEEAELLFALVRRRYGGRLSPTELDEVRRGVDALVESARTLRAVPLRNADGPDLPAFPADA